MARRRDGVNEKKEKMTSSPQFSVRGGTLFTGEEMGILKKINEYQNFFEGLEAICRDVEDSNSAINEACTAIRSIYKLYEGQKRCRDAFLPLVEDIDGVLNNGKEGLGSVLRVSPSGSTNLKAIVSVIKEISILLEEQNRGVTSRFLRKNNSPSYESKLKDIQNKLKRTKKNLRNSVKRDLESTKREMLDDLRVKLDSVAGARYSSEEGCLEDTRTDLLTEVDTWIKGPCTEKTTWVHGHVGSGKSALFNSIVGNLKNAGIPFICFPCKWGDSDLSNVHKVLPTISYHFASVYDDYRATVHDVLQNHSASTDGVKKQSELLFGDSYELVSPEGSSRPPVHVILIDALDECRNHRNRDETVHERHDLLEVLLDFANTVSWIKVLITSRPEQDIAHAFDNTAYPVRQINISSDKWSPSAPAMRHFLLVTSEKLDLDLSYDQIERFREKASGFFLWYAMVFNCIKEVQENRKHFIESILEEPSPDTSDASLYLLYRRSLDLAISEAQDKELVKSILEVIFIASTGQSLSATAIADIIYPEEEGEGLKEKKKQVDGVIRSLSSILSIAEGSKVVRACHSTALDFLIRVLDGDGLMVSSQQEVDLIKPFSIGPEEMHARILDRYLATMRRDLRFNVCDLEDPHRLNRDVVDLPGRIAHCISGNLRHASLFWASHLRGCDAKECGEKVFAFLNSPMALLWMEVLSLLNVLDRGIIALQDCALFLAAEPSVADIANEWERFLVGYGDAAKSTPHLYLSALSWIPRSSSLWYIIHSSFSSELPITTNAPDAWKNENLPGNIGTGVRSVAYSPDGRVFAAGCYDGSVRFWNIRLRKKEREPFLTESNIWSIAFSSNGHWLASGHEDGTIRLWDLRAESAVPRTFEGHAWIVRSVVFSADGKKLVSGSEDRSVRLWNVESGAAIGRPFRGPGRKYDVNSVAFSADDTRIICGLGNGSIRICNTETGEQIGEPLKGPMDRVNSVASSPDGRFIVSGHGSYERAGTIILWDAQTYEQIKELTGHTRDVNSVCFSPDSKYIASSSGDSSVRVWSVGKRSMASVIEMRTDRASSVAFSLDGRSILSGSFDGTVSIMEIEEAALADLPSAEPARVGVSFISYVPDSSLIVSGSDNGVIDLWNTQTGAAVGKPLQSHMAAVTALAVSSDGQWLVSGSNDETLRIWDITSGTPIGEPMLGHTNSISSVAVTPDNQLVISASLDGTVRLWDAATSKFLRTLKEDESEVTSMALHVDGNTVILSYDDDTIRLQNIHTGDVGQPLEGHSSWALGLAVSPNGQWIASYIYDGTVQISSMSTLSVIHVLEGHFDSINSVSFSPDSRLLISISNEKTVRVRNAQTGEAICDSPTDHSDYIRSVTFAPDGHTFASASRDGTIRVWDTRARTDLGSRKEFRTDYSQCSDEELRIQWNQSRARMSVEDDGWIKDGEKLLLWVPQRYRRDLKAGCRLIIGTRNPDKVKPQVDYRKMFKYSGTCWKDIYTGKIAPIS